jgi:hypothetical protein
MVTHEKRDDNDSKDISDVNDTLGANVTKGQNGAYDYVTELFM